MAEAWAGDVRCWCGESQLEALRPDYRRCPACGSVVYSQPYDPAQYTSTEPAGFYGDGYWRRHVPEHLGLPGLEERARTDLPERAVFHLRRILEHLAPGARILELGCGAGSLTYLLRQAGFDAAGVELGPAAIELARGRFGIEVHPGPVEELDLAGGYDAIVAVDVLEHLPDPVSTMARCVDLLAADGLIFLQTPCYRGDGPGWEMLLPREHLVLFTEGSVEKLLRAAGFRSVEVRDSLFPYDMWVAAARQSKLPLRQQPVEGVAPVAVALIDAFVDSLRRQTERAAVDADRELKETENERLRRELAAVREDQRAKEDLLGAQDADLEDLRRDQAAKDELISEVSTELATVRRDQVAKGELIENLSTELATVRRDQAAKSERIEDLSGKLATVRRDQADKEQLIEDLSGEIATVRRDQADKEQLIEDLSAELAAVRRDQADKEQLIERLSAELGEVRRDQAAKEELIARLDAELRSTRQGSRG